MLRMTVFEHLRSIHADSKHVADVRSWTTLITARPAYKLEVPIISIS